LQEFRSCRIEDKTARARGILKSRSVQPIEQTSSFCNSCNS
jgi:hypothetical protein